MAGPPSTISRCVAFDELPLQGAAGLLLPPAPVATAHRWQTVHLAWSDLWHVALQTFSLPCRVNCCALLHLRV